MEREDIHIISRNSNLTEKAVAKALQEHVYNDREAWKKFFRLFFISLSVGFTVLGIVFFFAYNWADLHKFVKIGLTEGVLLVTTILAVVPKINNTIKNVILTGASVLVGVLFAVFGQIYQTGANAYDFFLAWTIFISLWVFVSNFSPLWLLYVVLINTTFILYSQQVAKDWSEIFVCFSVFMINAVILITALFVGKNRIPHWFLNTITLAAVSSATLGIVIGIFGRHQPIYSVLILLTIITYTLGIWHGLKIKSGFYLSVIPFSLIIITSSLLIRVADGEAMFLLISLFIIASITFTIKNLIDIQKKWTHEK